MSIVSRISAGVRAVAALVPESCESWACRVNEACLDALANGRREPMEGAPDGALCYQGGVPCESSARCPVLKMRPLGR
jgi:hypothetical protein